MKIRKREFMQIFLIVRKNAIHIVYASILAIHLVYAFYTMNIGRL